MDGGGPEAGAMIRCRKCRRLIARGKHTLPHQPGVGLDAFSWHQRKKSAAAAAAAAAEVDAEGNVTASGREGGEVGWSGAPCQNIFLEPLAWMQGIEQGTVEGKLCCPKVRPRSLTGPTQCACVIFGHLTLPRATTALWCPCFECETKVGSFNWSGAQCSCGAWVCPSFYVQAGKVDILRPAAAAHPGAGAGRGAAAAIPVTRTAVPRFAVRTPVTRPSLS